MGKKRVVVVGAGPGGLTASMILASKGYEVEIFEKNVEIGGRNGAYRFDGFTFDIGPTFLMMRNLLEDVFNLSGRRVEDYLDIRRLDPFYRLLFADGTDFRPTADREAMREQIERLFPGNWPGYLRFLEVEQRKYDRISPCLQVPYSTLGAYLTPRFGKALPYLDAHKSLFGHLGGYFDADKLKIAFTFQAKYLGMSPWSCPATFSIISFIEHTGGIHHPVGGLNQISRAMAKVLGEEQGKIHLGTPVKQLLVEGRRAVGIELASGEKVHADHVVLNADFGYAMNELVPPGLLRRWSPEQLRTKGFSCSTFMLYLGVDKLYDIPHHNVIFAQDYKHNVDEIAERLVLSDDPSIYVQNACVTDPSLAPAGKSTLYVLVPVPNNRSGIDWPRETPGFRDKVLALLETRGGLAGLRQHIVAEKVVTPQDWQHQTNVYEGATFNLAHNIAQMLYFRPHNQFEEIDDLYLVGGGTHPGSGLPTIYESGRISAGLMLKRDAWYL